MKHSSERILTTHAGSLPRPADLLELVERDGPRAFDPAPAATRLSGAVGDIVRQQADLGIDVIDDGEYGKPSFVSYINERLGGYEVDKVCRPAQSVGRRLAKGGLFPEFYAQTHAASRHTHMVCTGPITYKGHGPLQRDIANLKAALTGVKIEEVFMPAISPSKHRGLAAQRLLQNARRNMSSGHRRGDARGVSRPLSTPDLCCKSTTRDS